LRIKKQYGMFDQMGMVDASKAAVPFSDPIVVETSKQSAQKAIIVIKDELGVLPLDQKKKVLLINQQYSIKTPNDAYDHPALFSQLMEQDWPSLQTYETKFGLDAKDEEGVLKFVKANKFDVILCTNYYDRQEKPNTYVKALIDQGYPVVLITNTPYCIKDNAGLIPSAKTIVLNMNLTPDGMRTTKGVLLGKIKAGGSWPLSNYDPFKLRK
jgi:beta-N-acetylhexosaminidase